MSERTNLQTQKKRLTEKLARVEKGSQSAKNTAYHLKQVEDALAKLPPEPGSAPAPTPAPPA